ncbi:hypothetical protein GTZ99_12390 [Novosphingobium sp. FSY-8]|uniref:Uncharacterized protein n=1 Tax=Novosphingobium ovatum TaxID=1908523 RepID=A0ABW9XFL8_9SPHN|nr:hypothetical protein [Novosphingobium ovatum]NBC37349.1 hypothetical protein [Novosphingobium ovatum]
MPAGLHITRHAIQRYIERVEAVHPVRAMRALRSPAIASAMTFGAPIVKLGTGQRVVIRAGAVVTVLPSDMSPHRLSMARFDLERDDDG